MSRPRNESPKPTGPDGATATAPMRMTGLVKTSKGYAVATATLRADGSVECVALGRSQPFKENIAREHKPVVIAEAMKA